MKAGSTILATPQLRILSQEQKETLFLRVLEALEHTGVQVGQRGMIDTIMRGTEITPELLDLDTMEQVGPVGSYFRKTHTVRHFRKNWFPKLMSRGNYDQWTAAGGLSMGDKANPHVLQILREHEPEPLPPEVVSELEKLEVL